MIKIAALGHVDDGKSTLLGRLLYECDGLKIDDLSAIKHASLKRGMEFDPSLVTDGLKQERAQGITMDVAYRHLITSRHHFLIADCPGHKEFMRNAVTGAFGAQIALLLVDGTRGIQEQTRSHLKLCSLLKIPKVIICINKMDLVGFSEMRFQELKTQIESLCAHLDITETLSIPISALRGDQIVAPSPSLTWFKGPCVLEALSPCPPESPQGLRALIQRHFKELVEVYLSSGTLHEADILTHAITGKSYSVKELRAGPHRKTSVKAPASLTLILDRPYTADRGDILSTHPLPLIGNTLEADACWLSDANKEGQRLEFQFLSKRVQGLIQMGSLKASEIGAIELGLSQTISLDRFVEHQETGSFIGIDPISKRTILAGFVKSLRFQTKD